MTNLVYAAWREPGSAVPATALRHLAARLAPEGLAAGEPVLAHGPGAALLLTSPRGAARQSGLAAHTGAFSGAWPRWAEPGSGVPDGTFALIRGDAGRTELCADFAGSRTLWYARTEARFFAATSQRALAALLGSLDPDPAAFPWFLSSGTLGPGAAWDRRVRRLPAGARLVLDHADWRATVHLPPPAEFRPADLDPREASAMLDAALREAFSGFDFSEGRWVLPLSGGVDCRYLLAQLLARGLRLPTVTWGMAASLDRPGNDAFVARRLAERCGLAHAYLVTEASSAPPERVVDRFLEASGGTTDQLFPYLDGLALWAGLAERGVDGILRGDEGFGWVPVRTERHARLSVGLARLEDILDPATAEALGAEAQPLPEALRHRPGETLPAYRDRLYHAFRIPVGLAALNEVKAPFVELAAPLLARPVLEAVRRLPDALRTDKRLFRRLAQAAGPRLPYATSGADDDRNGFLGSAGYTRFLREALEEDRHLPEAFRLRLMAALASGGGAPGASLRARLKRLVPGAWIRAARARIGPALPPDRLLALRAALGARTRRLLEADARSLQGDLCDR